MYYNGELLHKCAHFYDHIEYRIPIQVYKEEEHKEIGFVETFDQHFVKINNTLYNRAHYTFISRPGY